MESTGTPTTTRTLGLFGATGVGVGAIVGGGILALAGVAFATSGPAAILAFALNGCIALLTALSFAEMASKFPESGGTYTFAKKVLSVEASFGVGWVVWFASIVAGVLYALGFAHFFTLMVSDIWTGIAGSAPVWIREGITVKGLAAATTLILAAELARRTGGGGHFANIGKLVVFSILILAGLVAVARGEGGTISSSMRPFFSDGITGLVQAMGYTFIALQGFDLIAAVAGEVDKPERNVPRAMVMSLGIALIVYIPLLFVIVVAGVAEGGSIRELAASDPEGIVAVAAREFMGTFGYWLVVVAAVLSMYSALHANLFAASRIAQSMAEDRTLPALIGRVHQQRGTPRVAIAATAGLIIAIVLSVPDVATAGAASSLIFLVTFGLAHFISILIRQRSTRRPPPFLTPWFPAIPVVGGLACVALAMFQGFAVPSAGTIALIWLSVGTLMFLGLFAHRARVKGTVSEALNPELVTLRGRTPLVLVPIANPHNSKAMVALSDAIVPGHVGRVLLHTIVNAPSDWDPEQDGEPIRQAQIVLGELLRACEHVGVRAETLVTVADDPMNEIARVATLHRCESVLLGLSEIGAEQRNERMERLLSELDTDVVVFRSTPQWDPTSARKIVVPIGGKGGHDHLRAMLLGSLSRTAEREVTFIRVLPSASADDDIRRARRELKRLAADEVRHHSNVVVVQSDEPLQTIVDHISEADLAILGVQRLSRRHKLFGGFVRQVAQQTDRPLIVVSRSG